MHAVILLAALAVSGVASASDQGVAFSRLVEILVEPAEARRALIEQAFTDRFIEEAGIEGLVSVTGMLSRDLRGHVVVDEGVNGDMVDALVHVPETDSWLRVVVRFGSMPHHRIDSFQVMPASPPAATKVRDLGAAVREYMAERAGHGFTGAILVAHGETVLYQGAFGMADRASNRPNSSRTAFNIGSMNKMFTALIIGKLVEVGKLDWNDTVGRHLPDWPVARVRDEVTIAHLLSHQSGLGAFWGPRFDRARDSLDSVADFAALFDSEEPAFTPGARFRYSNNGYVLLGLIAEQATGDDYYTLVRRFVYEPAGMTSSGHFRRDALDGCCAVGYLADGRANTDTLSRRGSPAGGGYATMGDMFRFAQALQDGRIVSRETLVTMLQAHAAMGPDAAYGYGFGVFAKDGVRQWGHSGGAPGIGAELVVFPDSGHVLIVASNEDRLAPPVSAGLQRMILAVAR